MKRQFLSDREARICLLLVVIVFLLINYFVGIDRIAELLRALYTPVR